MVALWNAPLGAQARLEKNIYKWPYSYRNSSYPQSFAQVGESLYFLGTQWREFTGLWRTELRRGTTRRVMVLPASYELGNLSYSGIRPLGGGALSFSSMDMGGIQRVYFSNGTKEGSGLFSSGRGDLAATLIFSPDGKRALAATRNGLQLLDPLTWKGVVLTKGVFARGALVTQLPSPRGTWRSLFLVHQVLTGGSQAQLWQSDGSVAGTRMLSRFPGYEVPGGYAQPVLPQLPEVQGHYLFFLGSGSKLSLWSIPLDLGKPRRLFQNAGKGSFAFLGWRRSKAVFWSGLQVIETDGTPSGTRILLPASLKILGKPVLLQDKFFFPRATAKTGVELFVSEGGPSSLRLFADLAPGPQSSFPKGLCRSGGRLFFDTKTSGLWASDGTVAGTRNFAPKMRFAEYGWLIRGTYRVPVPGGRILFAGVSDRYGIEPFVTDGTSAGTRLLAKIAADSDGDASPGPLLAGAQGLFFQAEQLYFHGFFFKPTQGSVGKGFGIHDGWDPLLPPVLLSQGDRLLYPKRKTRSGPNEPWVTDGSPAGAFSLQSFFNPAPKELRGFFGGVGTETLILGKGHRLWRSDGTKKGSLYLGQPFGTQGLGRLRVLPGARRFWFLHEQKAQVSLWKLDRGARALTLVKSFVARPAGTACLQALGDRCVFQLLDPVRGFQLWASDGSAAGTRLLANTKGALSADPARPPLILGGRLYLTGESVAGKRSVYRTDGTAKGTAKAFSLPALGMKRMEAVATETQLFLLGSDAKTGTELWVSDGRQAGTRLLADLLPGREGSEPTRIGRVGSRRVFFYAFRPETGYELWVSDGTPAGTRMLQDLYPGIQPLDIPEPVAPARFQGGRIYFGAQGPRVGFELHSMGSGAVAEVLGGGCQDLVLALRGSDPVLGAKARVRGESPKGSALRVLLLGKPASRLVPLPGGCAGVLDPGLPFLVLDAATSSGAPWSRSFSIPKLKSLNGLRLALQAFYLKPASTQPPLASQGLTWVLGS